MEVMKKNIKWNEGDTVFNLVEEAIHKQDKVVLIVCFKVCNAKSVRKSK